MKKIILAGLASTYLMLTGCASTPMTSVGATASPISQNDIFSRQFTYDEADLTPLVGSTRPSSIILLNKGVNAEKSNKALCEGFTQLDTATDVEEQGIAITSQVVTKIPVTSKISQNENDCEKILAVYDYDLAKKKLNELNPEFAKSSGPFVAVINPNSSKIEQLIDLRGVEAKKLKEFGNNWYSIFNEAVVKSSVETQKTGKRSAFDFLLSLKKFFNTTVCITNPNLIYIFNESAGKIADAIVCDPKKA